MRALTPHRPTRVPTLLLACAYGTAAWWSPASPARATTANVALVSQYKFRGIDQTWSRPAVQGGADLVAASGL